MSTVLKHRAKGPAVQFELKSFDNPTEVRVFEKGRLELVTVAGCTIGRLTLEPGWRWSTHVKPIAGTEWCEAPHFQYQISGRLHGCMADGTAIDSGPGDVTYLGPGHDGWVVGNEPVVLIDWNGALEYAKK
jgi:hypothetical protein